MSNNVIVSNNYVSTNPDYVVESEQQFNNSQRQVIATFPKYKLSDVDDALDPVYLGYLDVSGKWYVLRILTDSEFRYVKGDSDYSTSWNNRASLTYDLYNLVF